MNERNYGIDFLRIISMFMIVILHVLGQGGILGNSEVHSSYYWVAWFLEIVAYCAVNCFALISGYVMYNSNIKISKIIELWLQIAFYTIGITIIMFSYFPDVRNIGNIINAIFPITRGQYWYLSSYFAMYMFIPIMNIGINKLDKKTLKNILIAVFFIMSLFPTLLRSNPYQLLDGYSTGWLCILYLTGGYIKKYKVFKEKRGITALLIFLSSTTVTFLTKFLIEYIAKVFLKTNTYGGIFVSYTSPTIILSGLALFVFCEKLKFKVNIQKIIKLLSSAALGVYIIHVHPLVFNNIINGFAIKFINCNSLMMVIKVIISSIIIYITCSVIELIRIKHFKILKIREICLKIDNLPFFYKQKKQIKKTYKGATLKA